MLCVYSKTKVEKSRLLLGIALVGTEHSQEVFRSGKVVLRVMDIQTLIVERILINCV